MKITNAMIEAYVNQAGFAESTQRSETARLRAVASVVDGVSPERLWAAIAERKPYTRVTTWTRVAAFADWLISQGEATAPNVYVDWRRKNARLFKGSYVRRLPQMEFADAEARLKELPAASSKLAQEILYSGLRYSESRSHEAGEVVGKGGKRRAVYVPAIAGPRFVQSYSTFRRHLQAVGLNPHDLRKLAATQLVESGANEFELKEVMGWTTLAPAQSYVRVKQRRVRELMTKVRGVVK